MKLYIREDGTVQKRKGFPDAYSTGDPIPLKRGDNTSFEIQFLDARGNPKKKASTAYVAVALKEKDKFDGSLVAFGSTTTAPTNDDGSYDVTVDTDTDEIDVLLAVNATTADDVTYSDVGCEVALSETGGGTSATDWVRSQTVYARVHNNVFRPSDTAPSRGARFAQYEFNALTLNDAHPASPEPDGAKSVATNALYVSIGSDNTATINVSTGAGGLGTDITIKLVADLSAVTPAAGQVFIQNTGPSARSSTNILAAINGTSNEALAKYGASAAGDSTNGIAGITAADGAADKVTLTAVNYGAHAITVTAGASPVGSEVLYRAHDVTEGHAPLATYAIISNDQLFYPTEWAYVINETTLLGSAGANPPKIHIGDVSTTGELTEWDDGLAPDGSVRSAIGDYPFNDPPTGGYILGDGTKKIYISVRQNAGTPAIGKSVDVVVRGYEVPNTAST